MTQERKKLINELLAEALTAYDAGDLATARQKFEECVAYDDGDEAPSREKRKEQGDLYVAWLRYGGLLEAQGLWQEAARALERAVVVRYLRPIGYSLLGQCYQKLGRYEDAERAYRLSLEAKPERWTYLCLYFLLAKFFEDREEEAVQYLYKCLELDPLYEEAYYNLGCCFWRRGDLEEAARHFEATLEIDSEYRRASTMLGAVHLRRRYDGDADLDLESIEELFLRDADLGANFVWTYVYLGTVNWEMNRRRKAQAWYRKAVELFPDYSMPHCCYGDFLMAQGSLSEGERLLRRAIELDPEDPSPHYFLGKRLLEHERFEEARWHLLEADRLGHERAHELLDE